MSALIPVTNLEHEGRHAAGYLTQTARDFRADGFENTAEDFSTAAQILRTLSYGGIVNTDELQNAAEQAAYFADLSGAFKEEGMENTSSDFRYAAEVIEGLIAERD